MFNSFEDTTGKELAKLIAGDLLGYGMSRKTYEYELDESLVIKIETSGGKFQNVLEWEFWKDIKESKYAKWFAPCVEISPSGLFLIQKRTTPIPKEDYPKMIPSFFSDTKYSNFGVIIEKGKKRFVCHDYGNLCTNTKFNDKMVKAHFWGE